MLNIPDNVRHDLIRLIPLSVVNDVSCFVHYDNHPRDTKRIDVIICTVNGEVKEFYQRELVAQICLGRTIPLEIKLLRNDACELFYTVAAEDKLIILSRKENLVVHRRIDNVERYAIDDSLCDGQACLKIIRKDDAVPLIFDEKLESLGDSGLLISNVQEETLPILSDLNRKLIEAKYSVKCNENVFKEYSNLRQLAAFSMYQKNHPNLEESVFKGGSIEVASAFNIKTYTPWVSVCNEKIVIVLNIVNKNEESLENVHMLLHIKNRSSVVYTTKLFKKINKLPFWEEEQTQIIAKDREFALVTIVDIKEVKDNVTSRLDISGIIVYTKMGKEHTLPFDEVSLSALDTMGEKFDVLSCNEIDEYHMILAVLAATDKTDLIMRHIRKDEDPALDLLATFCTYLLMERVKNTSNILIHRKSPYHPLNGLMIIFWENNSDSRDCYTVSIHSRTPAQVLAFIHYINDALPYKIIITTANQKIIAKTEEYSQYNEEVTTDEASEIDYSKYASAMINQTGMLIEHLDTCMVKMNDSKEPDVQRLIGTQIDVFAAGLHNYTELRENILNEEMRGIKQLNDKPNCNVD